MRELVAKFELNEREYFKNLYKDTDINVDDLGIDFIMLVMEYYKEDNGMYYKLYLNGKQVNWNDLNNYQKQFINDFEHENKILFRF